MTLTELARARNTGLIRVKQEMFDAAVRGLARQHWTKSCDGGSCVYQDIDGNRCAWGHVDTDEAIAKVRGDVLSLRRDKRGLAAQLDDQEAEFALALQSAHDSSWSTREMVRNFIKLAEKHDLVWPAEVERQ